MPDTASKSKAKRKLVTSPAVPGVIRADEVYVVDEARHRLRLGEWAWRQMRRAGLPVLRVGGRAFISGSALIAFIEEHGRSPDSESNETEEGHSG